MRGSKGGEKVMHRELAKIFPSVIARILRTQRRDWVRVWVEDPRVFCSRLQVIEKYKTSHYKGKNFTLLFLYKNLFYKNVKAEIDTDVKNILRTYPT